jgi:transcription elongation GreA/GreB family factor
MVNSDSLKHDILNVILAKLDMRILTLEQSVQSALKSKSNETKSSAGDKFETGRAMIQNEQEMRESILQQTKTLKAKALQVDLEKKHTKVEFGSLVFTTSGIYFISIGMGKLIFQDQVYFVVSVDAPVTKLLIGKKLGSSFNLNNNSHEILEIE